MFLSLSIEKFVNNFRHFQASNLLSVGGIAFFIASKQMRQLFIRPFPRILLPLAINTHFITYACLTFFRLTISSLLLVGSFDAAEVFVTFTALSPDRAQGIPGTGRIVVSAKRGNGEAISKSKVQTNRT